MNKNCNFPGCGCISAQRCSRCKEVYYCSVDHQKKDWGSHKVSCNTSTAKNVDKKCKKIGETCGDTTDAAQCTGDGIKGGGSSEKVGNSTSTGESEKRQSRCMFCGEQLVLVSEDDAVDHMKVCVALQEQLASSDQFTIPKAMREENNLNTDK